ncbi:MAG: alpha/beta hydrolase [Pseudomonadota bacterium]
MKRLSYLKRVAAVVFAASIVLATPLAAATFGKLAGQVYGSGNKVVVVLHGDVSRGGPADYHYAFAKQIASRNKGVTAIALLRPGYADRKGQKSGGSNSGRRDHYTKRNNDMVAQALSAIKKQYGAKRLIVVGHSGGAAQAGVILGRYPGLISGAVLVSCPCNIPAWRAAKNASAWSRSQSPHRFVKNIRRGTPVVLITGSKDTNTKPNLAQDFAAKAKAAGARASFVSANGAGHGFNRLSGKAASAVKSMVR